MSVSRLIPHVRSLRLMAAGWMIAASMLPITIFAQDAQIRTCGTPTPPRAEVERSTAAAARFGRFSAVFRVERATIEIPVLYHVIGSGAEPEIDSLRLQRQTEVLNAAFNRHGISFATAAIDRRVNAAWYTMLSGSPEEAAAKHELGKDPARMLNVYVARPREVKNGETSDLLGFATYPWWLPDPTWDAGLDGVVIAASSLPNGGGRFGDGATAVHEVAHWIGLLHTFHDVDLDGNGCTPLGDEIADTPYEAAPYFGPGLGAACPARVAGTCPGTASRPVSNYMDYTDDRCMTEFTPQQDLRMRNMLQQYRPALVRSSPSIQKLQQGNRTLRNLGY